MEKKLRRVLRKLGFGRKGDQISLNSSETGRVAGYIISPRFRRQTQEQRQDALWKGLEAELTKDELRLIVTILTMTPEEVDDSIAA